MERYFELSDATPFSDEVIENYHAEKERIQDPNYNVDLKFRRLKRSL